MRSSGMPVNSSGVVRTKPESTCSRTCTRIVSRISCSSRHLKRSKSGLNRTISSKLTQKLSVRTACMKSMLLSRPLTRRLIRLMCFARLAREIGLCAATCRIACTRSVPPSWPRSSTKDASTENSRIMTTCCRPGRTPSRVTEDDIRTTKSFTPSFSSADLNRDGYRSNHKLLCRQSLALHFALINLQNLK